VVVVENVYRHLSEQPPGSNTSRSAIVLEAAKEVAQPVLFGILIIILVFLPILSLQGMEGKMFKPLAYTIMIALLVSLMLSLTLSPALCSMALTRGTEEDTWLLRKAKQWYAPSLTWALTHRRVVLTAALMMLGASLTLFRFSAANSFRSSTKPRSRRRRSACPASRSKNPSRLRWRCSGR
jgi:cobalt-zinc-cadmium resistance protein CzcA